MSEQPKTALVTGGASGMGRIIARRLASAGTAVAILDLNEAGLAETAEGFDNIHGFLCDISDEAAVQAAVSRVQQTLGTIDRLVHAAALMPSRSLANTSPGDVLKLTQVNYAGTLYIVHALLPDMLERNAGEIVVFGSIAGKAMVPRMGAYCASKAAVNVYIETLIHELAHTGLGIYLICPPAVNTPLVEQTLVVDTPGSVLEAHKSGRLADPEKIVDAIDKGIAKGKRIIYPGEARFLYLLHALFPGLWWRLVMSFEGKDGSGSAT